MALQKDYEKTRFLKLLGCQSRFGARLREKSIMFSEGCGRPLRLPSPVCGQSQWRPNPHGATAKQGTSKAKMG